MATRINLRFGDVVVPAELNDTETARALASRLPATIRVSGTGIDFCGPMPFGLPYDEAQVGRGWANGDVNHNPGGWFALLFGDGENSARYGDQVNMGRVVGPLDALHDLSGSYDLVVERA